MKMTNLLVAGCLLAAGSAVAQTYSTSTSSGMFVARANVVSSTVTAAVGVNPASSRPALVCMRGSVIASATITAELADNTILNSAPTAVNTTVGCTSFSVPLYFEQLRVSQTTLAGGNNAISVTIIQ